MRFCSFPLSKEQSPTDSNLPPIPSVNINYCEGTLAGNDQPKYASEDMLSRTTRDCLSTPKELRRTPHQSKTINGKKIKKEKDWLQTLWW